MRRKIKELMNKEEGFTLVELLAVIVILGIIVAIAIPAIGSVIDRAGDDADSAEEALIVDAARLYFTTADNQDEESVTVDTLFEQGYLEDRGSDSPGEGLPSGTVKKVTTGGNITYEFDGN